MIKNRIAVYDRQLNKTDFNLEWIKNQKHGIKHIQIYYKRNPFMRIGNCSHKSLLEKFLREFKIEFEVRDSHFESYKVPLENKNGIYELVGAGKVELVNEKLEFSGGSFEYKKGTNLEHLEKIFEKSKVVCDRNRFYF